MKRNVDFTRGNIIRSLIIFALPIMAGEIMQDLYHSVDSLVLGNFVGESALAAASICGTLTNLLVGFCNGMSVGSTVVVSKAFGSKDDVRLRKSVTYTYSFAVVLGIVVSILGFVLSPFLIKICNVNSEIYDNALLYLRIYVAGLIFTVVYNNSAGILRAMGDMRTPFYILLVSCSLNIVLDLLFSAVLDWGVAGVAIATIICQFISVIIAHIVIRKRGYDCIRIPETLKNGMPTIRETVDVGFSSGVQASIISFSNLFIWRYVNVFSTATVAGIGVGHKVDKFVSLPANAFGSSATTFVGQNLGAKEYGRIRKGVRICLLLTVAFGWALVLLIYPFIPSIASVFNSNPEVVQVATDMLHILIPCCFLNAIRQVITGVLRAHGFSKMPMILSLVGMVGVRQIWLALSMKFFPKVTDIYLGYPIGWLFAALFVCVYFLFCRKHMAGFSKEEQ